MIRREFNHGKQEHFLAPMEGQLIVMLDGVPDIELNFLNRAKEDLVLRRRQV